MATSVKLDDDLKNRIQQLADTQQHSAHWIMRTAIREYVEREEACKRFKQEALISWTAYQETGIWGPGNMGTDLFYWHNKDGSQSLMLLWPQLFVAVAVCTATSGLECHRSRSWNSCRN